VNLADEVAIERIVERLLLRYAHAVDRRDYDAIAGCYWPDAVDEHDSFQGPAPDYVAWLREVLPPIAVSTHQFTNILVDVASDSQASSETYCLNVNVFTSADGSPDTLTTTLLRYLDRFSCRDGEWRIIHRRVVTDWTRAETPPPMRRDPPAKPK
jgi:ketosteroid isomerase-like protein